MDGVMIRMNYPKAILLGSVVLHIASLGLFLVSFLNVPNLSSEYASLNDLPSFSVYNNGSKINESVLKSAYRARFSKLVFVLVDALRADFIPTLSQGLYPHVTMPFVERMIKRGSTLAFIGEAQAPTVTLPRIKAMMTGAAPSFVDVIKNLRADGLNEDSFLLQAFKHNKRILFYGDDTWIKLFPKYFLRQEGTTSFFVSDYTEVDSNVTRNLENEMQREDWDIMILHYLGLDHIGHLSGPKSGLVKPKLREMDKVIEYIFSQSKIRSQSTLIVLCGDHGMTLGGSHGGTSSDEVLVPVIFIPVPTAKFPNRKLEKVQQLDIAATLSVLYGLPIPVNSIGKIIPELMDMYGILPHEQLYILEYNLQQLYRVFERSGLEVSTSSAPSLKNFWTKNMDLESFARIKQDYLIAVASLGRKFTSTTIGYDLYGIVLSIAIMAILILSAASLFFEDARVHVLHAFLIGIGIIVGLIVHRIICACVASITCTGTYWNILCPILIGLSIVMLKQLHFKRFDVVQNLGFDLLLTFIFAGNVLHVISLFSSSFVEEEHQTWYYLTLTLLILIFTSSLGSQYFTSVGKKSGQKTLFTYIAIFILFRLLRAWNRTGNKWMHLPDLSDWLISNDIILKFSVMLALTVVFQLRKREPRIYNALLFSCLLLICEYKTRILRQFVNVSEQTLAMIIYVLCLTPVFHGLSYSLDKSSSKRTRIVLKTLSTSWCLLTALLHRPHNVPLHAMIILMERLVKRVTWKENVSPFVCTTTYLWLGRCSFFYQGNSNMLSTIDLSAGYTGLQSYNVILVGILTVINTYSGLVFWLLQCMYHYCKTCPTTIMVPNVLLLQRYISICAFLVCVFIMRYHLFIWSVFAPKLLYESVLSVILSLFSLCLILLNVLLFKRSINFS